MRKTIILASMLVGLTASAQDYDKRVGINTTTPRASLEVKAVDFDGRTQGILFPYINETEKANWTKDKDKGLVAGTVIWNTTKVCLDYFDGDKWQCTDGTKKNTPPTTWFDVATLEITPLAFSGEYKDGKVFTNANTVKFKLKNTGTEAISNLNLTNAVTIVNGAATITATGQNTDAINIPAGGYIEITYILSGKPEEGLLTATLSYEDKTVSNSTTVAENIATLPDGMNVNIGHHTILSIYDNNYFPFTAPATDAVASWEIDVAPTSDTILENLVDIQGTIPTNGIDVKIPITYDGTDTTLEAYTSKAVAIAPKGEQGVTNSTRKLILSWNEQTITSSTKFITAKITPADGQDLNVTKLDTNAGFGGDLKGTKLAEFSLPKSNLDTSIKVIYAIRVSPGIPDKFYGQADKLHDFIYLPIRADDGKIWLNNNLGADYAKYGGEYFNPFQQATTHIDWKAYGSLFQWQRPADGHELVTWEDANNPRKVSDVVTSPMGDSNWTASHSNFIQGNSLYRFSWIQGSDAIQTAKRNLWQAQKPNNPCPSGFHVPLRSEWTTLHNNRTDKEVSYWAEINSLHLPVVPGRTFKGDMSELGFAIYWSSEMYLRNYPSLTTHLFYFDVSGSGEMSGGMFSTAYSIRCIID